ncbi:MAG TPA: hypothetical protein VEQ42_11680, partial [Pyrinomonadaceae bacterium]|nr:hypothetical protein [Pyrinomonadaceae bacterium]
MASAKNFQTLCASALALTLACVRAENTHTATAAPGAETVVNPDAGNVSASEHFDPEAQGDDALAAARE